MDRVFFRDGTFFHILAVLKPEPTKESSETSLTKSKTGLELVKPLADNGTNNGTGSPYDLVIIPLIHKAKVK